MNIQEREFSQEDVSADATPSKRSNPLGALVICFVFVAFGIGAGIGATQYMDNVGDKKSNRSKVSKAKENFNILRWLAGGDSNGSKNKKNKYGPFDSVFGNSYEPPVQPQYQSPLSETPTISF